VTRRHFASLEPNRVLALRRLSASTASLHVAPDGSRRCSILGKSSFLRHGSMSALGQKQTYALQQAMSALHPIATEKADMRQ
jgi:hypothetical protein